MKATSLDLYFYPGWRLWPMGERLWRREGFAAFLYLPFVKVYVQWRAMV